MRQKWLFPFPPSIPHLTIPPLHADASSHCQASSPQVTSMCLSKGLSLIPREQKGILAVKISGMSNWTTALEAGCAHPGQLGFCWSGVRLDFKNQRQLLYHLCRAPEEGTATKATEQANGRGRIRARGLRLHVCIVLCLPHRLNQTLHSLFGPSANRKTLLQRLM